MVKEIRIFILLVFFMVGCNLQIQRIEKNIELLENAKTRVLLDSNDDQALDVILDLLKDNNTTNRTNAAGYLGQIAVKKGKAIKDKALPSLIRMLDEGDQFDKNAAAAALLAFGADAEPAIPALRRNLFPSDTSTAYFSAKTLGKIGDPAYIAVSDLLEVIVNNQIDVPTHEHPSRGSAIRALGEIGPRSDKAIPVLENLLQNSHNKMDKIKASVALIRIAPSNTKSLKELELLSNDQDVEIRRKLMWELQDAGAESKPALRLVKLAQKDTDHPVRVSAIQILKILEES